MIKNKCQSFRSIQNLAYVPEGHLVGSMSINIAPLSHRDNWWVAPGQFSSRHIIWLYEFAPTVPMGRREPSGGKFIFYPRMVAMRPDDYYEKLLLIANRRIFNLEIIHGLQIGES